jgi:hypothetical protein
MNPCEVERHPFDSILGRSQCEAPQQDAHSLNQCIPFPWKLHEMLDVAENEGLDCIVSWLPGANAFKVHNPDNFMSHLMPRYFKQTKYKSFQRQLNIWGFERILYGQDKGGYRHANFVRGKQSLCRHIIRQKIKGTSKTSSGRPRSPTQSGQSLIPPPSHSSSPSSVTSSHPRTPEDVESAPLPLEITSSNNIQPLDGDCVLFEGRNFYFVSEYHPDTVIKQPRRFSLELSPQRRRYSLTALIGESFSDRCGAKESQTLDLFPSNASNVVDTTMYVNPKGRQPTMASNRFVGINNFRRKTHIEISRFANNEATVP